MFLIITAAIAAVWLWLMAFDHAVDGTGARQPVQAVIPNFISAAVFLALGLSHGWPWLVGLVLTSMVLGVLFYRFFVD